MVVTNPGPGGRSSNPVNFAVNNPAPTITYLSPASVMAGSGSQTLVINGSGFVQGSTVTYNGAPRASTFVNALMLTIILSTSDQATAGNFAVLVNNPAPGGGSSNSASFAVNDSGSPPGSPQPSTSLNVPLTVQEALYPGGSAGVSRTNEPFCMGVPLADSAGITSTSTLGLAGTTAGQFRVLGRWPDGNDKWVKVCGVLPNLSAGGTATVTLTNAGSGNFGGSNLATDNGSTITVATGAATFTIKKANFNVLDSVVIGSTTIVAPTASATRGLIITGPSPTAAFPGNVTCTPSSCTTVYSSANDPQSLCSIEENGPVMAAIKCTGNHIDNSGHAYMHFTAREIFYKDKGSVKVTSILRNADYSTSQIPSSDAGGNTFNTAYKGLQSYELRISPNVLGTLNYTIATDSAPQTGALSGTDSAYIYQGQSQFMIPAVPADCDYQSPCANSYTSDTGFSVVKNGSTLVTGTSTQFPAGWADISDQRGNGVEIGVYQMAAYWPKSLEFNAGGTDLRIGIWPRQNSQPIYQAWPSWSIHDLFLEFHTSKPPSLANEFLKSQHYLLARASVAYYNSTGVFPYPLVDPAVEDNYYINAAQTANPQIPLANFCWKGTSPCTPDRGVGDPSAIATALGLGVYRSYTWGEGGPLNQEEFRWSDLQRFLQRGQAGRYLNSAHFYRFLAEKGWAHADGTFSADSIVNHFTWRSRPQATQENQELDNIGNPQLACGGDSPCSTLTNSSRSFVNWATQDPLHFHWYGILDYYFLSGDETIREAIIPLKDFYLNNNTYQGGISGGLGYTRSLGIELMAGSRFSEFLQATGDPEYPGVLSQALSNYNSWVKPDVCVSGYPVGCVMPPLKTDASPYDPSGISRVRGVHLANSARAQGWCPAGSGPDGYREQSAFQASILQEGMLALRRAEGPSWSDYETSLDLAYGLSQWELSEAFSDDGSAHWKGANDLYNGFRYAVPTDIPNVCRNGTPVIPDHTIQIGGAVYDIDSLANADQGMWMAFYVSYLVNGTTDWERKFKIAMDQVAYHQSVFPADFGSYQIGTLISAISHPGIPTLQDIPFTAHDNGGGTYALTFTPPAGSQSLRIKWSPKIILNSNTLLGFDNLFTNTFATDPATHSIWFGANNTAEPAPTPGLQQTFTIKTGTVGLTAPNFSVKAYIASGTSAVGPAANLLLVGGGGQTGTAGQPLTGPFTVKVTDVNGNPVSGIGVNFTVTAGGGTLTVSQTTTNSQGLASSTLTLGATAGTNAVIAASGTLAGSPITINATGLASGPQPAANLILVSGDGQTGTVGRSLSNPFTVEVTDVSGNPVSGIGVTFTVTAGGGMLTATQATTNSQGLASSTLTLGATAGTNAVIAASGTLAGSPITINATSGASDPHADVTWTKVWTSPQLPALAVPGWIGWLQLHYDPVSQQTILYGTSSASTSIYSSDLYFYNTSSHAWTYLRGTGSLIDACSLDSATQPGDRHPVGQMAIDTKRNVLWLYGGVNQMCNGNPIGPNANPRLDMYYLQLAANPLNDVWHRVAPAHIPAANATAAMVYDPDDDVLFAFGYDGGGSAQDNWVYCPGTLTAKQLAAGCTAADDWSEVLAIRGVQPLGVNFPGMVYDTLTKKIILYAGTSSGLSTQYNQTWAYDVPTRTWTQKALSTTPPPLFNGPSGVNQPALAYNSTSHKILYHQTSNSGAPADWQYDPVADTWTKLTSAGGGAQVDQTLAYDPRNNMLIGWNQNQSTGGAELWQGALSTTLSANDGTPSNPNPAPILHAQVASRKRFLHLR